MLTCTLQSISCHCAASPVFTGVAETALHLVVGSPGASQEGAGLRHCLLSTATWAQSPHPAWGPVHAPGARPGPARALPARAALEACLQLLPAACGTDWNSEHSVGTLFSWIGVWALAVSTAVVPEP